MSVQPAFSIVAPVAGTGAASASLGAAQTQDPFAALLAALLGPIPGPEQPGASSGAAAPALVQDQPETPFPSGAPSLGPGAIGAELATIPGGELLARQPDAISRSGDSTAGSGERAAGSDVQPMGGAGPEILADTGPAPPSTLPGTAGAPRLIRDAPSDAGARPSPPTPGQVAGAPVIPGTTEGPRPSASPLSDPAARPEIPAPGSLPGPSQGPNAHFGSPRDLNAHLEPDGAAALGRGERPASATLPPSLPPSLPTRPVGEGVASQIGIQVARAASSELRQVVVQLEPAELGRVQIRLEFAEHGGLKASFAVERIETLELLQREAQSLERSLQATGLRLDAGGLGFSLRRERGQEGPDDEAGASAARATDEAAGDPFASPGGTGAPGALALSARLLDIRA